MNTVQKHKEQWHLLLGLEKYICPFTTVKVTSRRQVHLDLDKLTFIP
jgi:hypothetical protein